MAIGGTTEKSVCLWAAGYCIARGLGLQVDLLALRTRLEMCGCFGSGSVAEHVDSCSHEEIRLHFRSQEKRKKLHNLFQQGYRSYHLT